jgi:hypothetical protein
MNTARPQRWVAARGAEQAVAVRKRGARVESHPSLQFAHEGPIGHLHTVAGHDKIPHPIDLPAIRDENDINAGRRGRVFELREIGCRHRPSVILCACRLAVRNGVAQDGRTFIAGSVLVYDGAVARQIKPHLADKPASIRGQREVFSGAPQAHIEVVIIRVDGGSAS